MVLNGILVILLHKCSIWSLTIRLNMCEITGLGCATIGHVHTYPRCKLEKKRKKSIIEDIMRNSNGLPH